MATPYRHRMSIPAFNSDRTRRMAGVHERRAQKAGVKCDRIDIGRFYHQRRGICGVCRQPVDFDTFTIDHIRPIAKGGAHSLWNIQLAHVSCNSSKDGSLPASLSA